MTIRAAGAVVRRGNDVLVVHRPRHDDWSLPKGKVHKHEEPLLAARREVAEETGCEIALGPSLGHTRYRVTEHGDPVEKRVDWWLGRVGDERPREPDDEVDQHLWLPLDDAAARLSWEADRSVLERARRISVVTSTVLLVRHASAGKAEDWPGHDDDRPLDKRGRAQVERLRSVLPVFWLSDEQPFVAAPSIVRCVDTVSWAGEVVTDERLGYDVWQQDPEGPLAWVRELAAHRVAVAGSQGGVVGTVVETLRAQDGLPSGPTPERKGSAWVLSFADGRLVAADYLDSD